MIMSDKHVPNNGGNKGGAIELSSIQRNYGNRQGRDEGKQEEEEKPVVLLSTKQKRVHAFLNRKQEVIL